MPHSSILEELLLQPGDTEGIGTLIQAYPYYETPYILKALAEKNTASIHQAVLMNNNAAWVHVLLQEQEQPVAAPVGETIQEVQQVAEPVSHTETTTPPENEPATHAEQMAAEEAVLPLVEAAAVNVPVMEQPVHTGTAPRLTDNITQPETITTVTMEEKPAETLAFEPYHTVDYFASQGIKAVKENNPTDRLSQQLRSFTEWLKTMKKLPSGELNTPAATPPQQQKVLEMAETSLKNTEVITETMAEVLVKQGRVPEAIEILEKLSLQDKAKSAYFAARIQHLKTI